MSSLIKFSQRSPVTGIQAVMFCVDKNICNGFLKYHISYCAFTWRSLIEDGTYTHPSVKGEALIRGQRSFEDLNLSGWIGKLISLTKQYTI